MTMKQVNIPNLVYSFWRFRKNINYMFDDFCRRYGMFYRVKGPFQSFYICTDPKIGIDVFTKKSRHISRGSLMKNQTMVFGNGLIISEGEEWLGQRRSLNQFFSPRALSTLEDDASLVTRNYLQRWQKGKAFNVQSWCGEVSLEILMRILFGQENSSTKEILQATNDIAAYFAKKFIIPFDLPAFVPWTSFWKFRRAIKYLEQQIEQMEPRGGQSLLAFMRENQGQQAGSARDQLINFLLAGQDTTAQSLCFAFFLLGRYPVVRQRFIKACREGNDNAYIDAVIDEVLRLFPVVPNLGRHVVADMDINGTTVKKNDIFIFYTWSLHRDENFFENPNAFIPERWLDGKLKDAPYYPFGMGQRFCIGKAMSLKEIKVVLIEIFKQFDIEDIGAIDESILTSITIQFKNGLVITPR